MSLWIRQRQLLLLLLVTIFIGRNQALDCPWSSDPRFANDLSPESCQCSDGKDGKDSDSSGGGGNGGPLALSVDCVEVNFTMLAAALQAHGQGTVIELLSITNSSVPKLPDFVFRNLRIISLRVRGAGAVDVGHNAFRGLENTLQSLDLSSNRLRHVPVMPLRQLRLVSALDLSGNSISHVPDNAFVTLRLKTLKMAGNEGLTLADNALRGLEGSLKNLNLAGCGLRRLPAAIGALKGLAFLDLAQNNLRDIPAGVLKNLDSLAALNLERNIIQKLEGGVFIGVEDTLSSLSLLNNLLTEFPVEAINRLSKLRVLDLGFNLLRVLPPSAFQRITDLTLLALDGNPMATLPEEAFAHLNKTLKGLSLGGRFLTCDCRMRWVTQWIRRHDLQVTSREREPQFCGHPQQLRDASFYQLQPEDLTCGPPEPKQPPPTRRTTLPPPPPTTPPPPPPRKKSPAQLLPLGPTPRPPVRSLPPNPTRLPPPRGLRPVPDGFRPQSPSSPLRPVVKTLKVLDEHRPQNRPPPPPPPPQQKHQPGDVVTEIRMTVGEEPHNKRSQLQQQLSPIQQLQKLSGRQQQRDIRVPPPTVISSEPIGGSGSGGGLLAPRGRGPPQSPPLSGSGIISRPREPPTRPNPQQNGGLNNNLPPNPNGSRGGPRIVNKSSVGVGPRNNHPIANRGPTTPPPRPPPPPPPPRPRSANPITTVQSAPRRRSDVDLRPVQGDRVVDNRRGEQAGQQLPRLASTSSSSTSSKSSSSTPEEVIVRDAYKEDSAIVIKWESETSNILGFRVVYRLFGKPDFKQGPPLAPSEREFRIKNVPGNECIVVCVVSLEEVRITPSSVPHEQCREIRTSGVGRARQLDWVVVPASSAIVATVVIAVIIFIACIKSNHKHREAKILDEKPIHTLSMSTGMGTLGPRSGHMSSMPPQPPLAGLAALGLGPQTQKEWDQLSMYSQRTDRSVPRARMYHMERAGTGSINGGYIPEDARSHISAMSAATASARNKSRSIGDLTGKASYGPGGGGNFGLGRADLRQSRQSLVSHAGNFESQTGRQSRASGVSRASRRSMGRSGGTGTSVGMFRAPPGIVGNPASTATFSRRSVRQRSMSRDRLTYDRDNDSLNHDDEDEEEEEEDEELTEEEEEQWATSTADNWTDYDQDIYMHRNTTKFGGRHGGMFGRDDVNL